VTADSKTSPHNQREAEPRQSTRGIKIAFAIYALWLALLLSMAILDLFA